MFGFLIVLACLATGIFSAEIVVEPMKEKVVYLTAATTIQHEPNVRNHGFFDNQLRIYCYKANDKTLGRIFESIELELDINNDDYTQYEGSTPQEVKSHYDDQRSLFSFNLFYQKRTRLPISPFVQQCIGIETKHPYRLTLHQIRVDFWRVIQLAVGLLLFSYAKHLSNNALFYYITGVSLGICSSFMLLIWLSSKLVPRKTMMYGVLISGWTIGLYVIQLLWENIQMIIVTYRTYVFWYITVTGVLSFFFCYRLGPPKNRRSQNIIQWLLQLAAVLLIYFCSYFEEATAAIILITLTIYYFPLKLYYKLKSLYLRKFPPKPRLLTSEEFYEQGVRETTKALEELRTFAGSPDCKQWKVMSKLKDPLRFAAFVEGASHLRDDEILQFEVNKDDDESELTESSEDDFENHEELEGNISRLDHRSAYTSLLGHSKSEHTQLNIYDKNRFVRYNSLQSPTSPSRHIRATKQQPSQYSYTANTSSKYHQNSDQYELSSESDRDDN